MFQSSFTSSYLAGDNPGLGSLLMMKTEIWKSLQDFLDIYGSIHWMDIHESRLHSLPLIQVDDDDSGVKEKAWLVWPPSDDTSTHQDIHPRSPWELLAGLVLSTPLVTSHFSLLAIHEVLVEDQEEVASPDFGDSISLGGLLGACLEHTQHAVN